MPKGTQRKRHPSKKDRKKKKDEDDNDSDVNFDDIEEGADARGAEIKKMAAHEFAAAICEETDDDAIMEMWLAYYYVKWDCFPNKGLNDLMENVLRKLKEQIQKQCKKKKVKGKINLKKLGRALNLFDPDTCDEEIVAMVSKAANVGFDKVMGQALNRAVAAGVAKSAATPAVLLGKAGAAKAAGAAGRRGAVVAVQRSAGLMASQGGSAALKALAAPGVGIATMAGELAAEGICIALGVEDKQTKEYAAAGGSIMAGIAAGAAVGGPFGAAAGAGVGAASWAVGQGVKGLMRVGHGPNDNWCYLACGDIDGSICAGTYAGDDGLYWKTYGHKYYKSNSTDVFSAGNKQKKCFQVCIWDKNGSDFKTYENVHYRDTFFVSRVKGKTVIVYAKGGYNKDRPGTIERKAFW